MIAPTPKEKAIELVNSFKPLCGGYMGESVNRQFAKQSAIISAKEVQNANAVWYKDSIPYKYWEEVQNEINKL